MLPVTLQVTEYDCLLLEHVFGQRPADSVKVRTWVLETLASDPGLQQTELLFLGLFGRACRLLEERDPQARPSRPLEFQGASHITCGPKLFLIAQCRLRMGQERFHK